MREILLGFWILISTLSIVDVRAQDSTSYFPLHVGDFWRYKGDEQPWSGKEVAGTAIMNGIHYFVCRWYPFYQGIVADAVDDTVRIDSSANVLFLNRSKEQVLYKFNSRVGDSWVYDYTFNNGDSTTHVVTLESVLDSFQIVDGPASGIYHNVFVFFDDQPGFIDAWSYSYFAPEFGLIYKQWQLDQRTMYGAVIDGKLYGDTTTTDVRIIEATVPKTFRLFQNHPNPFNPTTTIQYQLSARSHVDLSVYDVIGRKVRALDSGFKNPGTYEAKFEGGDLPSGIYFYRLVTGAKVLVGKAMLIK